MMGPGSCLVHNLCCIHVVILQSLTLHIISSYCQEWSLSIKELTLREVMCAQLWPSYPKIIKNIIQFLKFSWKCLSNYFYQGKCLFSVLSLCPLFKFGCGNLDLILSILIVLWCRYIAILHLYIANTLKH